MLQSCGNALFYFFIDRFDSISSPIGEWMDAADLHSRGPIGESARALGTHATREGSPTDSPSTMKIP